MGLTADRIRDSLDGLAAIEPAIGRRLGQIGYPEPRIRERGHESLLRAIIAQQVSVAAATAIWNRLEQAMGVGIDLATLASATDDTLRGIGLSRQKAGYMRSLAEEVATGRIDLHHLPEDDEAAIAALTRIKGIGRWSAEIYLLFAEGRGDAWPAGDLALQIEIGRILGFDGRPDEKTLRDATESWRPYRGAAAIFGWHSYAATAAGQAPL